MMSGKNMRKKVIITIFALCIGVLLIIFVVLKLRNPENDRELNTQNNSSINIDDEESTNKGKNDEEDKEDIVSDQEQLKDHTLSDKELTEEDNLLSDNVESKDVRSDGIVLPDDEWETP